MLETPLDSITVSRFRSISSVKSPPLRPINVVIGANGSGKSNFVGVFSFLHAIREGRLQEYVRRAGGAEQLLHFGSRTTSLIHLQLSFGDGVNYYSLSLVPTDDDTLYPHDETAYYFDRSRYATR